jgi:Xaa-Pro aminopeptidase
MGAQRLARVQALLQKQNLDALVITHPPNIRYVTGLNASAGAAVVSRNRCVLTVDFRYVTAARTIAGATAGIEVEVSAGPLDEAIGTAIARLDSRSVGIEAEHLPVARFNRLRASTQARAADQRAVMLLPTEGLVERLRAVKDDEEIAILREAGRRISAVARRLRELVLPGQSELEGAAAIDAAMRTAGFERPAFETIVASGPNGALPHARPTDRKLVEGEGVVLDFGGVYDGYCVDLTRTLQLGRVSAEFRRMFDAVRDAQAAAIAAVRPGVPATDIDGAARAVLASHGLGEAFGHGTGHGLGLEVHEEPRISKLAPSGEVVTAGMVFTIEPGAYVPGVGGVRIEDDVLVVAGGCELLTDVPVEL